MLDQSLSTASYGRAQAIRSGTRGQGFGASSPTGRQAVRRPSSVASRPATVLIYAGVAAPASSAGHVTDAPPNEAHVMSVVQCTARSIIFVPVSQM